MADSEAEGKKLIVDWVNLPEDAKETSLWASLHDAELKSVRLDRLGRTLDLEFDVEHLRDFHCFADSTRFLLRFEGVHALRVEISAPWPGEFSVPADTPYAEAERLRAGYWEKSIQESAPWPEFVKQVEQEQGTTEVYQATLATGPSGLALRLSLNVNYESYPDVSVSAERMSISLSTGEDLSLHDFLQLGEFYWNDLAAGEPSGTIQ